MSEFETRMKTKADALSKAAKQVVKQVLVSEHKNRFTDRQKLPEDYARLALQAAKKLETSE